jgi:hypothetical protein
MKPPSVETIARIIRLGADALDGSALDPTEIVRTMMSIGLDFAGEQDLKAALTQEARDRADALAEMAEDAKFGDEQ